MKTERDQNKKNEQPSRDRSEPQKKQHSSAFNESNRGDEKSTINIEEEAGVEQQHNEAMMERD